MVKAGADLVFDLAGVKRVSIESIVLHNDRAKGQGETSADLLPPFPEIEKQVKSVVPVNQGCLVDEQGRINGLLLQCVDFPIKRHGDRLNVVVKGSLEKAHGRGEHAGNRDPSGAMHTRQCDQFRAVFETESPPARKNGVV